MSWGIGCTLIGSQTNLMYEYSIVMILNETSSKSLVHKYMYIRRPLTVQKKQNTCKHVFIDMSTVWSVYQSINNKSNVGYRTGVC